MNEIKVNISDEQLYNILDSAFAAGISYWCNLAEVNKAVKGAKYLGEHVVNGGSVWITDDEDKRHLLTKEKLLHGLSLTGNHNFEDYDAYDADRAVQLALFGQVVYA